MTTQTLPRTSPANAAPAHGAGPVRQIVTLVRRNLIHLKLQPGMLTDVTIQPMLFFLLSAEVFGCAFEFPGLHGVQE